MIFTPDNEPYRGRKLLHMLDRLICATVAANADVAPRSHDPALADLQRMAADVIPQAVSISLSIRELIRQGYLFGGRVMVRPLVERATILLYLDLYPDEIGAWNRGWHAGDAPGLAKMFEKMQSAQGKDTVVPGRDLTSSMNALMHAKPESAVWNLVPVGDFDMGQAASKILTRPDLCDELCADVLPWLVVVNAMMNRYFGEPAGT